MASTVKMSVVPRRSPIVSAYLRTAVATTLWLLVGSAHAGTDVSPPDAPPFEPVEIDRVSLPAEIVDASQPAYTHDGEHLLFMANATTGDANMWIVGEDGSNPRNLTGGVAGKPSMPNGGAEPSGELEQPGLIMPFPDGERVFFGPYGDPRVLECSPSVVNCQSKEILDIDLSGARPDGPLPPGGAVDSQQQNLEFGARPQISPDGNWIKFSDIRTDAIEIMVLARLNRADDGSGYTTSDPVVLNPAGPTSPTDKDTRAWSNSTALFESKIFVDGGRAVTYVQVGGEAGGNPDIWKVDLKTGERTRLTGHPDWQEDHGQSPDGQWDVASIDSRGTDFLTYLSLMPYRSFFNAWEIAPVAQIAVAGAKLRSCAPFSPRLLPASGDMGGRLMGQVLQPYDGGDIRPSGNYQGPGMWKPDGTAVALSTQSFTTLGGAPYLEIARFPAREPTEPQPIVSSEPGNWAPAPEEYHGALGAKLGEEIVLPGEHSGTVTVRYDQGFFTSVENTATYVDYSDDGNVFLNGTDRVERTGASSLGGTTRVETNLTLTGEHTGSLVRDITYVVGDPGTISGNSMVTYDGVTLHGLETPQERCDTVRDRLPGKVPLNATTHRPGINSLEVKVTAAYPGAGRDQQGEDRRPVRGAKVKTAGGETFTTDRNGTAVLPLGASSSTIEVSAGDTFEPTTLTPSSSGGSSDPLWLAFLLVVLARSAWRARQPAT